MKRPRSVRHVLVILFREDRLDSRTYRIPLWLLRTAIGAAGVLVITVLFAVALYGPIAGRAARVGGLEDEVATLRADNQRVYQLAAALDSMEAGYARLREMIGADGPLTSPDFEASLPVALAVLASTPGAGTPYPTGASIPTAWPLQHAGRLTRGAIFEAREVAGEAHPGLDVAVAEGTPVRASGGGTVVAAAHDTDYGIYVLIRHPDGYESMYGHLSRLTTTPGVVIGTGDVLGLSGNTGHSSAPHLHFEIRRNGRPIDPTTLVKEVP
jgi:murein DD-endopeptidase MepM/ murein hydrolase activator NlpD